jgi:hypothetical protein
MAVAIWPLVVMIVGGAIWGFASPGKAQDAGRIAFAVGLFWVVSVLATKTVHLF